MGNSASQEREQKAEAKRQADQRHQEAAEKKRHETEEAQRQRAEKIRRQEETLGVRANRTHWYWVLHDDGATTRQELLRYECHRMDDDDILWMTHGSSIVPTAGALTSGGGGDDHWRRDRQLRFSTLKANQIRVATADEIESWRVERRRGVECDVLCHDGCWRIGVIEEVGADSYTVSTKENALYIRVPMYAPHVMPLGTQADKRPPRLLVGVDPAAAAAVTKDPSAAAPPSFSDSCSSSSSSSPVPSASLPLPPPAAPPPPYSAS